VFVCGVINKAESEPWTGTNDAKLAAHHDDRCHLSRWFLQIPVWTVFNLTLGPKLSLDFLFSCQTWSGGVI
jgi:hypothetical protein